MAVKKIAKKVVAKKKAPVKKVVAKKKPVAKKVVAKKVAPKKVAAKKIVAKKVIVKKVITKKPIPAKIVPLKSKLTGSSQKGLKQFRAYEAKKGESYMSKSQLNHFRTILNEWKTELSQDIDRTVHKCKMNSLHMQILMIVQAKSLIWHLNSETVIANVNLSKK